MEIIEINQSNCHLLREFISNELSPHFRYFKSRTIETVLPNHLYTIVIRSLDTNTIEGYGHLDKDIISNKVWLGMCILNRSHGKGYGTKIIELLISKAQTLHLESIFLTVDKNNYKARLLYHKYKFEEIISTATNIQMERKFSLELPVSYGEAFDKLTILDIKLEKLKDVRRNDVQIEYDAIYSKIAPLFNKNIKYHYNILKVINLRIWEMQDIFRDSNNIDEKNKLCNEIIIDNDRRFRVKHKINHLLSSHLKEQKGYKKRRAFILNHLGHGDMLTMNGMVRYYSTLYDEVVVPCVKTFVSSMELVYADDPTITLMPVDSWAAISPERGFPMDKFKEITQGFDVILTGCNRNPFYGSHMLSNGRGNHALSLPFCFYHDLGLDKTIMWDYFHVAHCKEAMQLYNQINSICDNKFIIAQTNTSERENVISCELIENKFGISRDDYLIININSNYYTPDHHFYDIANKCVNLPLIHYMELLKHSFANILTNSALFCLAMQLDIDTDKNYCIGRGGGPENLSHLYDSYPINKKIKRFNFSF